MIDIANYILPDDHIIAVPRSMHGESIEGRVLAIVGHSLGRREFIVELAGSHWLCDGPVGLLENCYVFEVERGDSWVGVPPYLLEEEAEAKVERSVVNTRKRIQSKVPLFAAQIAFEVTSAERMISRAEAHRRETLERDHERAFQATDLRGRVQERVTPEQFKRLKETRSRFPRSPLYGIEFWRDQLRHIEEDGGPDIYVPAAPVAKTLKVPCLGPDAEVVWSAAPGGPRNVRVLFAGTASVLVKLVGEPVTDYDPREFPHGNAWVEATDLKGLETS